ncbi:MAG: hypothetical protein PHR65_06225 [Syntrophomonadaceae bacterium]|nr:hypothetical protein [Syntrophomonadaceae bacterium]
MKRCKGQISQDEYRANRDNRLLSRGDITKKGNPNTRLVTEGEKVYLIINTEQYETRGKVKRYIQLKTKVYYLGSLLKKLELLMDVTIVRWYWIT